MIQGLKEYIEAKTKVFTDYMQVPAERQGELTQLEADMMMLGESCADYQEFETRFASEGLSERYNNLLMNCQAKPMQFSKEQQRQMTKEATKAALDPQNMAKGAAESLVTELKSEAITMKRKKMIEEGVMDEYTRASNALDSAKSIGSFLARKLKK